MTIEHPLGHGGGHGTMANQYFIRLSIISIIPSDRNYMHIRPSSAGYSIFVCVTWPVPDHFDPKSNRTNPEQSENRNRI